MQIDSTLISRLERLARLKLDAAEREKMTGDLQRMLDMVDKLRELDTEGVEPLIYLNEDFQPAALPVEGQETEGLRKDEVARQLTQSEALQNAPKHDGQFFRVPKVVDKG